MLTIIGIPLNYLSTYEDLKRVAICHFLNMQLSFYTSISAEYRNNKPKYCTIYMQQYLFMPSTSYNKGLMHPKNIDNVDKWIKKCVWY